MTQRVHCVRHIKTTANTEKIVSGRNDYKGVEEGEPAVRESAKLVSKKIKKIICSDLSRGIQTANILKEEMFPKY